MTEMLFFAVIYLWLGTSGVLVLAIAGIAWLPDEHPWLEHTATALTALSMAMTLGFFALLLMEALILWLRS